jgi:hypothetical protein
VAGTGARAALAHLVIHVDDLLRPVRSRSGRLLSLGSALK